MSGMLAPVPGLPLAMALLIALPVTRAWAERFCADWRCCPHSVWR